jgi:predicted ATPase
MAVEDLHWIDDSSREFLTALVDELESLPLLVLATYRAPATPPPPWLGRWHVSQLALPPLSAEESLELVRLGPLPACCRRKTTSMNVQRPITCHRTVNGAW